MTNAFEFAQWVDDKVNSLYGAPGWFVVALFCLVIGYVLRSVKQFPNSGIPLVLIFVGSISNIFVAPSEPQGMTHKKWLALNAMIGAIIAFFAWRFHKSVLSKYENKIPFLSSLLHSGDTEVFTNPQKPAIPTADTNKPK